MSQVISPIAPLRAPRPLVALLRPSRVGRGGQVWGDGGSARLGLARPGGAMGAGREAGAESGPRGAEPLPGAPPAAGPGGAAPGARGGEPRRGAGWTDRCARAQGSSGASLLTPPPSS